MKEVKAPYNYNYLRPVIFLAGSIEMGEAVDWQARLVNDLSTYDDLLILNPRRTDWDASWVQRISNDNFHEQVDWEHRGLHDADIITFYFDANTKSPITLMELGLMANSGKKMIVCCPDGFWRKGNVEYICDTYDIQLVENYGDMYRAVCKELE